MNRHVTMLAALVAGSFVFSQRVSAGDGTTGSGAIRYLVGTVTWTEDHSYDDWGSGAALNVGTGDGAGHLSVQKGARVEVPGALFIAGKGYASSHRIEDGNDGRVTVGTGSTLVCGSQVSSASGAQIYVGWGSGVKGTLLVDGGELISNYILRVGCHVDSDGRMDVVNRGRVTLRLGEAITDDDSSFLSIATAAGSHGVLRVSGQSVLEFAPKAGERTRADIGAGGDGTLLVSGGSRVSLGQDYAFIGAESGSQGFVHVSDEALLELPRVTVMGRDAGSSGELVVEGKGTRLVGQGLTVGSQGTASFTLRDSARAELGSLELGVGSGAGRAGVSSGAQLATSGNTLIGKNGSLRLENGGQWVSAAPVEVEGITLLRGASQWQARDAVTFRSGSTLAFVVDSVERLPEITVASGSALTLPAGSRMLLTLSPSLLEAASGKGVELTLIRGELVGSDYDFVLVDESGLFDSSALSELRDGQWGLRLRLNRQALRDTLEADAARLAHGLWSSTGGVQDYTMALINRPNRSSGRQLWGMGLGAFSHLSSQGVSPGYDFHGGGYALGADGRAWSGRGLFGASFGQLYGNNKSTDGLTRIRQNSLMGSLYGRYDSHAGEPGRRMVLDAYAAYGRVHNRARSSMYSTGAARSSGRWSDDVYALGLRASWERPLTEQMSLLTFIGLRYIHGSHGAFSMEAEELSRDYSSATLHNLSIPLGFTLRSSYSFAGGQQLLPELTLAYQWDVSRCNPHLSTSMLGESVRSAGVAPGRHAFMLRPGAVWVINEHWSSALYYHIECRHHALSHGVNLSVGYAF